MNIWLISGLVAVLLIAVGMYLFMLYRCMIRIGEDEVGLIYKKHSFNLLRRSLTTGQLIARFGEAGWQARTLAPGPHYGYWHWLYEICKVPVTVIPPGQIGLVVAKDGMPLSPGQLLGQSVPCHDFQDGQMFLLEGGQRGKQLNVLATGVYRINTELFDVITAMNAHENGLKPEDLHVYTIDKGMIGVVTTLGGAPLPAGEIAGPLVTGHDNFQDLQKFIDARGCRGLQEEYLAAGAYRLNPWFIKVREIPLTNIPAGTVGVVISHVGKRTENQGSITDILVEPGYRGILKTPLYPGRHPINADVVDVAIVPTNPIALDWSAKKPESADRYDAKLQPLRLRSKDGFSFKIEVTQVIRIDAQNAPKMIASIGVPETDEANLNVGTIIQGTKRYSSIRSLITKVLEPTIGNYFRNSAQDATALDFHAQRIDRQVDAIRSIDKALEAHGVQAVDTLINEIDLPSEIAILLTDSAVAKQGRDTLKAQIAMEQERQDLERTKANFEIEIAQKRADARGHDTRAEAEAIQQELMARVEALNAEVIAVGGPEFYARVQEAARLADIQLPQFMGGDGAGGFMQLLMARMVGMDPTQLQLTTEQQPEFTVKQIDTFVDALGDYVQEGGGEKIRDAMLGHPRNRGQIDVIEMSAEDQPRLASATSRDRENRSVVAGRRSIVADS